MQRLVSKEMFFFVKKKNIPTCGVLNQGQMCRETERSLKGRIEGVLSLSFYNENNNNELNISQKVKTDTFYYTEINPLFSEIM